MYNTASNFRVSWLRNRGGAWLLLIVFLSSFLPATSFAQSPTAFIASVSGTVLVNGQARGRGTVLSAGDLLETQAGASVVLELSDGSTIELGEHTKLDIAVLAQTATGARTSQVKLWWGRVRATLSAGHQQAGSNFDIETPNALVGVKFSQPDVEVIYDQATQETTAFAYTVALWVTNLFTGEFRLVPVGSTVIITATAIKVFAGIIGAGAVGSEAAGTGTTGTVGGISKTTMVLIGAGALAAAGGVAAIAASSGDGNGASRRIPVEEAEPSDFFGQYDVTDPARTYEEWHATINFLSNMTFTYVECLDGRCYEGTGKWSFDKHTLFFSMRTDGGAQFSGTVSGTTDNFILSGTYADGTPGVNRFVRS